MKLSSETIGSGTPIAFVHGFTQTARSWTRVAQELLDFKCTLIDAPGHGSSPTAHRTLVECGTDIAETMEPGILVGYSMGARMALHAAIQHPEKIERLVLVSGTAGIENEKERNERIASDEALALHIEDVGVEQFISEWLANPMFAGLTAETSQVAERLRNSALGLADSLRYAGTGTQIPLWDQLSRLRMPVLIVAGERDQKFMALGQRMADIITNAQYAVIPNAGHTVHLENQEAFIRVLREFIHQ